KKIQHITIRERTENDELHRPTIYTPYRAIYHLCVKQVITFFQIFDEFIIKEHHIVTRFYTFI
ncbi:hypothetical protein KYX90_13835, partial [Enterococcus lactis]